MAFSQEDRDYFDLLNTSTISLLQISQKCSEDMIAAIRKYAMNAQAYANMHTATTGTNKRQFTDQIMSSLVDQGTPSVIHGSAIMPTLASDIGGHDKEEYFKFFERNGRSTELVTACFNQFAY